jgi:hypothetical protein
LGAVGVKEMVTMAMNPIIWDISSETKWFRAGSTKQNIPTKREMYPVSSQIITKKGHQQAVYL